MNGWTAKDIPSQAGRVVVITGANSGVGYESAVALAGKGAQVIMASRSIDKAQRAQQELLQDVPTAKVDLMRLDLSDLRSVRAFAEEFNASYARLDILMNNAGIMIPPYGKTTDGFEIQFGTNHLGHFALTGLLLPKLLITPAARIVTVSSSAYMMGGQINFGDLQSEQRYDAWGAYSQSKLANLLFMMELQRKLERTDANVISVASHPGYAATNLQKYTENGGFLQQLGMGILKPILSQNAELGATYQLYAATAANVRGGEFYGPRFVMRGEVVKVALNARARDAEAAARLWAVSEQLTGVRYEVLQTVVA
ncbi:MAG: SDR family NAD(P)-dependent oxidoreductase [Anaerolineae bacterium]|nr:SDR family NAD(P)-dependent oxidoreductase [Anaerolineae bacterium]